MENTITAGKNASLRTSASSKKILFANVPADGHFNPLTGLAVYLKSIGYDVRWYSSSYYEKKIRDLNIPYYPFNRALEMTGDNVGEIFPERNNHKSQVSKLRFDLVNAFILRSTEYFDDIKEIRESFPFDMMIADVAFSAIPLVKEKLNVPVIAMGILPLVETSRDLAPTGLGMEPSTSIPGRIKQAALRYLADNVLFKQPNEVMRNILKTYGIEAPKTNLFDLIARSSTLLLQSGTPGFEYKRSDLGKNIRFVGPLLPHISSRQRTPWFSEKLNKFEKVILVTQGTVEKDVEKIVVPTLEAFKNTNYLVVATTGGSNTLELKDRYAYHNVIIEDFIPFADIMPYADVYVTNGGYGGVLLAIENELPLVVAGIHEGKNEINARVGYFKLGMNLKTERPIPRQVQSSVEEVLSNNMYSRNVKRLSDEFRRYDANELSAQYIAQVLKVDHTVYPKSFGRVVSDKVY